MNTPRTAVLDVHKEGIMASMRDQFRRADTFLAELLQNGRRAGASRIDIEFDPATTVLAVTDDGSGIESPDLLFLIGRSGFREIVELARENPFGIGFAAALFAAGSIRIRTRGWSADFATADLLALQPVPIGAGGFAGTRIELTLHPERVRALLGKERLEAESLIPLIETLITGFPVPVWVDGQKLERPDALNEGYTGFPQGKLHIDFERTAPNGPVAVYLQGLPLEIDRLRPFHGYARWRGQGGKRTGTVRRAVVHLDSGAFRAQCPDRYAIVPDQGEAARHAINTAILAAWGGYLEARKAVLGGEDFALRHGDHCYEAEREDLLADTPLPPAYYRRLDEPPRQLRWDDDGVYRERAEEWLDLDRAVLSNGRVPRARGGMSAGRRQRAGRG